MEKNLKIMVSGLKPTGRPHVGNYFGAMKQFVDLQEKYKSYIFIANYHALTSLPKPSGVSSQNSFDIALDYLAIGLDPAKNNHLSPVGYSGSNRACLGIQLPDNRPLFEAGSRFQGRRSK